MVFPMDPRDPIAVLLATLQLQPEPDPSAVQSVWHGLDTTGLPGLVHQEGCALWLYRRLKQAGADLAPRPEFGSWLSRQAAEQAARNLLVDAEMVRLGAWLSGIGCPHVWLKGAARRIAAQRYPYADARVTSDIDLLVPSSVASDVQARLREAGYERPGELDRTPENHFHLPPLLGEDRVAVEVHLATSRHESPEEAWRRATTGVTRIERNGVTYPVPSATELLWHGLTHGLIQGTAAFRLRYLQDASVILASAEAIDWGVIVARLDSPEVPSRPLALRWLNAAARLAGCRLPPELSVPVPYALQRLLRWKLVSHRRWARMPRVREKLIDEGTRVELGWPVVEGVRGTSWPVQVRRRLAALGARSAYRVWWLLRRAPA